MIATGPACRTTNTITSRNTFKVIITTMCKFITNKCNVCGHVISCKVVICDRARPGEVCVLDIASTTTVKFKIGEGRIRASMVLSEIMEASTVENKCKRCAVDIV